MKTLHRIEIKGRGERNGAPYDIVCSQECQLGTTSRRIDDYETAVKRALLHAHSVEGRSHLGHDAEVVL